MLSCAVLSSLEVYSAPPVNIRNVSFFACAKQVEMKYLRGALHAQDELTTTTFCHPQKFDKGGRTGCANRIHGLRSSRPCPAPGRRRPP